MLNLFKATKKIKPLIVIRPHIQKFHIKPKYNSFFKIFSFPIKPISFGNIPNKRFYVTNKELGQLNVKVKEFLVDVQKGDKNLDQQLKRFLEGKNTGEKAYIVGKLLLTGDEEISKNEKKAFEILSDLASKGDSKSQYLLGLIYLHGIEGTTPKWETSLEWLVKAANLGHSKARKDVETLLNKMNDKAQENLSSIQDRLDQDEFDWYLKSSITGEADAMVVLANHYFKGKGTEKNEQQGIEWLKKAADKNNSTAHCNLGFCYYNGVGVERNEREAFKHLKQAVDLGNIGAHFTLGIIYKQNGEMEKSNYHFQQAMLGGNFEAAAELADSLADVDLKKATELAKIAFNNGSFLGRFLYGTFLLESSSAEEGYNLLRDMALEGHGPAQYKMFQCHMEGVGTERDENKAIEWLENAIKSSYEEAIFDYALINLGKLYPDLNIEKHASRGLETLRRLASQGYDDAIDYLKENNL